MGRQTREGGADKRWRGQTWSKNWAFLSIFFEGIPLKSCTARERERRRAQERPTRTRARDTSADEDDRVSRRAPTRRGRAGRREGAGGKESSKGERERERERPGTA
eukprot:2481099-Rhodomonas_salina.2